MLCTRGFYPELASGGSIRLPQSLMSLRHTQINEKGAPKLLSPEGAEYHSPGHRPGTRSHTTAPKALKGRDNRRARTPFVVVSPLQGSEILAVTQTRGYAPGYDIPPLRGSGASERFFRAETQRMAKSPSLRPLRLHGEHF